MRYLMTGAALLLGLTLSAPALVAQDLTPAQQAAADDAEEWLELVDAGEFEESWNLAAPLFREQVSAQDWVNAAEQVQSQIGALQRREVGQVSQQSSLPGAPPGEYTVIEFRSAFAGLPAAVETLVMRDEGNQEWMPVGYFVVPAQ